MVRFRTHGFFGEYNDGHGIIEALYNGSALNQTFMGDRLRSFSKPRRAVRVDKLKVDQPREVADLVAFLASPRASYLSGMMVPMDGGLTHRASAF